MIIQSDYDVTSSKIFTNSRISNEKMQYNPAGLFSEVIFGNKQAFTCHCGTIHKETDFGKRCPECDTLLGPSSLRRYVISRISFPIEILNPIIVMYKVPYPLLNKLLQEQVTISNVYTEIEDYLKQNYVPNKINLPLYTNQLIVLPPAVRPVSITGKRMNLDKLNHIYLNILTLLEKYDETLSDAEAAQIQLKHTLLFLSIQLYQHIIQNLTKKEGILRKFVLGKRNDFTGRSVITVDPTLKINEAGLPYLLAAIGYMPQVLYELSQAYNGIIAYDLLSKYINQPTQIPLNIQLEIEDILNRIVKDKMILLNRQPTLHRNSIQAYKPILQKARVLSIPMQACTPFNADFDGDTMAVYFPQTDTALKEVKKFMASDKNLLIPGSLRYSSFTQDLVLGIWFATSQEPESDQVISIKNLEETKKFKVNTLVEYNGKVNTAGRMYIGEILHTEIHSELKKKEISELLTNLILQQPKNIVELLHKLQQYALMFLPFSISVKDLIAASFDWKAPYKTHSKWSYNDIYDLVDQTQKEKKNLTLSNNINAMIHSGARGTLDQWSQCVLLRGFVRNSSGKLMIPPILSSLTEGYQPKEIVLSSVGNRKGIVDKALNTATSGYLTRKLVYALQHVLVSKEEDCGTTEGLTVLLTPANIGKYLFRYTVDGQYIDKSNYLDFVNKEVTLRSPIFCKSHDGICSKCYPIQKFYNSKTIGFISAQSLGEPGTQLTLRTFHTGGSAELKQLNLPSIFTLQEDGVYSTNVDLEIQTEQFEYDLDERLISDLDILVSWGESDQTSILLPRGTRIINPESFIGFHTAGSLLFNIELKAVDLATDLTYVSSILGKRYITTFDESLTYLEKLQTLYWSYQDIHSLHFELLHAERLRLEDGSYFRLQNNVDKQQQLVLESISNIAHSRLLLSLCFENFRKFFNTYLETSQSVLSPIEKLIDNINTLGKDGD